MPVAPQNLAVVAVPVPPPAQAGFYTLEKFIKNGVKYLKGITKPDKKLRYGH